MKPGIASPWVERPEPPTNFLEGAKPGSHAIAYAGIKYTVLVSLPFHLPDESHARGIAAQTLGECLSELVEKSARFSRELSAQSLALKQPPDPFLTSSVDFDLGVTHLYAVASSTALDAARARAVDRLAIALSVILAVDPQVEGILSTYRVTLVRNT